MSKSNKLRYPAGVVAMYGPNDKTVTMLVATTYLHKTAKPIQRKWVATDVTTNPKVLDELEDFFRQHGVKQVATTWGPIGCPHEEGKDFPRCGDCPFCPFWKGRQGSGRNNMARFSRPMVLTDLR